MNAWLYPKYMNIQNISRLERPSINMLLMEFAGCCATAGSDFQMQSVPLTTLPVVTPSFMFWHGSPSEGNGSANFLFCDGRVGSSTWNRMKGWGLEDAFWAYYPYHNGGTQYTN